MTLFIELTISMLKEVVLPSMRMYIPNSGGHAEALNLDMSNLYFLFSPGLQ